jgi:hypothetical protein
MTGSFTKFIRFFLFLLDRIKQGLQTVYKGQDAKTYESIRAAECNGIVQDCQTVRSVSQKALRIRQKSRFMANLTACSLMRRNAIYTRVENAPHSPDDRVYGAHGVLNRTSPRIEPSEDRDPLGKSYSFSNEASCRALRTPSISSFFFGIVRRDAFFRPDPVFLAVFVATPDFGRGARIRAMLICGELFQCVTLSI